MKALWKKLGVAIANRMPAAPIDELLGRFCPIFMLHRLHNGNGTKGPSRQRVARCLQYVRDHRFTALSLPQLVRHLHTGEPLPDKCVVFTIDDGFADHAEIGGELFSAFEVPLTCFVVSDFLDGALWPWDDQVAHVLASTKKSSFALSLPGGGLFSARLDGTPLQLLTVELQDRIKEVPQQELYAWLAELYRAADVQSPVGAPAHYRAMSWEDARRFVTRGHCIAPHTRSHRILSRLSDEQSREEIQGSVRRVNEMMGSAATVFAYPTGRPGDFGEREAGFLRETGILGAVSTVSRTAEPSDNMMALPRFSLPDNLDDFVQYLSFIEVAKNRLRGIRGGANFSR